MTSLTVTAAEAAKLLQVSEKTVRRRIATGALPRIALGGRRLLISRAVLMRAIDDGERVGRT